MNRVVGYSFFYKEGDDLMTQTQPLSTPSTLHTPDLIPVRMLNEFTYCPRLCFLEWIEQEWDDNAFTLEGKYHHRRVDQDQGELPEAETLELETELKGKARSVEMASHRLGLITKMDLLEYETGHMIPIEYKRGKAPENELKAWEPERVQLCAQALILRDNGYLCHTGIIYYAGSHKRVTITISEELIELTHERIEQLKTMCAKNEKPLPLEDSPKCPNCSLVGICLPDETLYDLAHPNQPAQVDTVRRLIPARDDAIALYVQEQGAYIRKQNENIKVTKQRDTVANAKLIELSHVCLFGNVQISTQTIQEFFKRNIPLVYFSYGGWFLGMLQGIPHKNVALRQCQYHCAESPSICLELAKQFVKSKILNCRTLLRRNSKHECNGALTELSHIEKQVDRAENLETLLGCEGNAGRIYFQYFSSMIKNNSETDESLHFDFTTRNRRPPRDPINALLSFAYSMLTKDWTLILWIVGFDPFLGFYHQPRYGRPALALDMMEPFRPLIADSVVLTCINNGIITPKEFVQRGSSVALNPEGRKRFLAAYERRMDQLITHPIFNYRISYRRVLEVQARLLGRYLTGEIKETPEFITR